MTPSCDACGSAGGPLFAFGLAGVRCGPCVTAWRKRFYAGREPPSPLALREYGPDGGLV